MFVFPSKYEGFGLPILEAMSCECPVITSNISSMPEVGGNAVEYAEPGEPEDLACKIEVLLDNARKREKMAISGLKRSQHFTWNLCAEKTENVYMSHMYKRDN